MINTAGRFLIATGIMAAAAATQAAHHEQDLKSVAKGWLMASCGDRDGFVEYVKAHMADDGVWQRERYVGLGFTIDNDELTILQVTEGTPAAEVLQPGDTFVSVNGMEATQENRDRMTFRGKPGEPVSAVVMRDGEEVEVAVDRGVIEFMQTKEEAVESLSLGDGEGWGTGTCEVQEMVQEGNVVYVHMAWTDVEQDTDIEFMGTDVTRFEFDDEGKVLRGWNRGEERFILEQLGYTISR